VRYIGNEDGPVTLWQDWAMRASLKIMAVSVICGGVCLYSHLVLGASKWMLMPVGAFLSFIVTELLRLPMVIRQYRTSRKLWEESMKVMEAMKARGEWDE
jgi:hypothetical protein